MLVFWLTAAGVLVLDLITKYLVSSGMELHSSITLIPGVLNFTYIENEGAAWGLLAGKQFLLQAFTIIVILGILGYVVKKKNKLPVLELVSFAMIAGGGLGNLIGRIAEGKVVDFIEFTFSSLFNIFNVADIGITFGCIFLVISLLIPEKSSAKKTVPVTGDGDRTPDKDGPVPVDAEVSVNNTGPADTDDRSNDN